MDETPRSDTPSTRPGSPGEKGHRPPPKTDAPKTDAPKTDAPLPGEPPPTRRGAPWGLLILLVVIAFAGGFLWQFYEASTVRDQLTVAEQELAMERLRVHLGQAALAAQSRDYESARRQMSTFFTQLQEESAGMTPEVRAVAENFLSMRDDVITGLSRSNPEYAGVLYGMLEEFGDAVDASMPAADGGLPAGDGPDAIPPGGQPDSDTAG